MLPYKVNELLSVPSGPYKVLFSHGRMERKYRPSSVFDSKQLDGFARDSLERTSMECMTNARLSGQALNLPLISTYWYGTRELNERTAHKS